MHVEADLLRMETQVAGLRVLLALRRFATSYTRRYSDNQARVPAGEPGAGQWMSEGDGDDDDGGLGSTTDLSTDARTTLVGGFEPGDVDKTVQQFMSEKCEGRIRAEMPGQFLDTTIGDVQALAKSGDADARTCIKLLGRQKYRK